MSYRCTCDSNPFQQTCPVHSSTQHRYSAVPIAKLKVKEYLLPFNGNTIIPAGGVGSLDASPYTNFRPLWLVIPVYIGKDLRVVDIQQGNECLVIGGGEVDAYCFRETLAKKNRIFLSWRTMRVSERCKITLRNISDKALNPTAHLLGLGETYC